LRSDSSLCLRLVVRYRLINGRGDVLVGQTGRSRSRAGSGRGCGRNVAAGSRRVRSCLRPIWWPERLRPGVSRKPPSQLSRIVAYRNYGALISGCVLCVTRHVLESASRSGTFCGMRVVPSMSHAGGAPGAMPDPAVRAAARWADGPTAPACSTPRNERRTVCRTGTPSRWNMPEALVGVTVRQPCCLVRESRSVILVLAMQKMATIVALVRREAMCPPVRMV